MDPLLTKTLIDALADDRPHQARSSRPSTRSVPARVRAAAAMRRWADLVEPRTPEPTVCSL